MRVEDVDQVARRLAAFLGSRTLGGGFETLGEDLFRCLSELRALVHVKSKPLSRKEMFLEFVRTFRG